MNCGSILAVRREGMRCSGDKRRSEETFTQEPSAEELDKDYSFRGSNRLPQAGSITTVFAFKCIICNCLKFKRTPSTPPFLYSSDNLPFWMGFPWADRWENMWPGSSQQARVGNPVKEKVIGCYKRSPFQGKENQISKGCTILYFLY